MPSNAHIIDNLPSEGVSDVITPIVTNDYRSDNQRFLNLSQTGINFNIPRQIVCKTNMKSLHRILIAGVINNSTLNYRIYPDYARIIFGLQMSLDTIEGQTVLLINSNLYGSSVYLHCLYDYGSNFEYFGSLDGISIPISFVNSSPVTIELAILNY